jgi:DNA-directed RNA polymerase subunit N (RpoN/RPB10)
MSIVIHRENKDVYSKKRYRMIIGVICLIIGERCITCGPVLTLKRYSEHSYTMSDKNQEIEKNVSDQTGVEGQRTGVNVFDRVVLYC